MGTSEFQEAVLENRLAEAEEKLAKLEKFLQGELAYDDGTMDYLSDEEAGQLRMARYIAGLIDFTPTKED